VIKARGEIGKVTKIGIIRHGLTNWNRERRVQGKTNIALNKIGIFQAKALANR
jgi:2,3-bisphosphoglycerate-dependent phosphoglycerate mutase